MKKGTIKIGDKVNFSELFIEDWKSKRLITRVNENWWRTVHLVTKVGYEDERCRPIENLDEYDGVIGDEYVIFDNDEKTYSNTNGDYMVILNT